MKNIIYRFFLISCILLCRCDFPNKNEDLNGKEVVKSDNCQDRNRAEFVSLDSLVNWLYSNEYYHFIDTLKSRNFCDLTLLYGEHYFIEVKLKIVDSTLNQRTGITTKKLPVRFLGSDSLLFNHDRIINCSELLYFVNSTCALDNIENRVPVEFIIEQERVDKNSAKKILLCLFRSGIKFTVNGNYWDNYLQLLFISKI